MNTRLILLALLLIAGFSIVVFADKPENTPEEKKSAKEATSEAVTDTMKLAQDNNAFAFDLYARLSQQEGNIFFSPYSISTALAMIYAGARGNTEKQIAQTLHFTLPQEKLHLAVQSISEDLIDSKYYQLHIANALWGQKGEKFLDAFLELNKKYYGAGLNEVDFMKATEEARQTINVWVEKQTRDKIKELISKGILNALTLLILTNAIYFKGSWELEFDSKKTTDTAFTLMDNKSISVPMMYRKGYYRYVEERGFQMLELPYKGKRLSMLILLPDKVEGLAELGRSLNTDYFNKLLNGLTKREVRVNLPRFKIIREFELTKTLIGMGMLDAFSRKADFSGIYGKKDIFFSNVIHKAFVDVNEEGTEAAASTGIVMSKNGGGPLFRADHPFLFLIQDMQSGSILFLGRMMNPRVDE